MRGATHFRWAAPKLAPTQRVAFLGCGPCRGGSKPTDALLARSPRGSAIGGQRWLSSTQVRSKDFGFAFDVDGVLLRKNEPIPGAKKALETLREQRIPFILLTNGGGKLESERVEELSERLDVPLSTDNFVQSHTPFQTLADLKEKTVLVTGADGQKCREIAHSYGFKNVVIPADILQAQPSLWPFDPLMKSVYEAQARPLPRPIYHPEQHPDVESSLKIDAIFVYNDPRDWALDIQIITDLLVLADQGYLSTVDKSPPKKLSKATRPTLYTSNRDVWWSADHHLPRLGQGAFQAALHAVYVRSFRVRGSVRHAGNIKMPQVHFGKPERETFLFAENVLRQYHKGVLKDESELKTVYMVGDNITSDILGANAYTSPHGTAWKSFLVRTGVYQDWQNKFSRTAKPTHEVNDVWEAVESALSEH